VEWKKKNNSNGYLNLVSPLKKEAGIRIIFNKKDCRRIP
jgi:hypothetical protein